MTGIRDTKPTPVPGSLANQCVVIVCTVDYAGIARSAAQFSAEQFMEGGCCAQSEGRSLADSMWPRLRRLLGPHAHQEWERRLMTPAYR